MHAASSSTMYISFNHGYFLRALAINMYAIYTHAKASCVYFVKVDKILTISNFVILTMHTLMLLADVLVARIPFSVTMFQTYFI